MTTYEILWLKVPSSARGGAHVPTHTDSGVETQTKANQCYQEVPPCALATPPITDQYLLQTSVTQSTASSGNSEADFLLTMDQHKQTQQKEYRILEEKHRATVREAFEVPESRVNKLAFVTMTHYSTIQLVPSFNWNPYNSF